LARDDRQPKEAACLERDGVIVPRKRQWPDAGSFPVMRGGLILVLNDRRRCHYAGDKAQNGD